MKSRTIFALGVVSVGLYMMYRQTSALPGLLGVIATASPTPASLQAQLIAGAQAAQTIIELPITIPPPPAMIS